MLFPLCVLRRPASSARNAGGLIKIVKENLREFQNGVSISQICQTYGKITSESKNPDLRKVKQASMKLCEGDVRAAVRCLSSTDSIATKSEKTLRDLRERHPGRSSNEDMPDARALDFDEGVEVTTRQVRDAIFSFPAASAGGIDGLRPRHLKDMMGVAGAQDSALLAALAEL